MRSSCQFTETSYLWCVVSLLLYSVHSTATYAPSGFDEKRLVSRGCAWLDHSGVQASDDDYQVLVRYLLSSLLSLLTKRDTRRTRYDRDRSKSKLEKRRKKMSHSRSRLTLGPPFFLDTTLRFQKQKATCNKEKVYFSS